MRGKRGIDITDDYISFLTMAVETNHLYLQHLSQVLRQVKVVVNLERQLVPDKVDHQVACDTLADATEALEQCVNTALIRLIVQVYQLVSRILSFLSILQKMRTKGWKVTLCLHRLVKWCIDSGKEPRVL